MNRSYSTCEFDPDIYSVDLPSEPSSVGLARLMLRAALWDWQMDHLADAAQLVMSELASNAIKFGDAASAHIYLRGGDTEGGALLAIEVFDSSQDLPEIIEAGPDDENHRGLAIVEALCTEWGAERVGTGKFVWAHLACDESSDQ